MGFWSRLLGRVEVMPIAELDAGKCVVEGTVEVLDPERLIADPVTGDLCVFAHYEAYMPDYAQRLMIVGGGGPMNLVAKSAQGTDFLLRDGSGLAFVRVNAGADLMALHPDMLRRHGFELKAQTRLIKGGDRVRVSGQVLKMTEGSPMRREGHDLWIEATGIDPCED